MAHITLGPDEIPPPTDPSLDVENETLEWSHVFQPLLPSGFELTTELDISYTVYVTDRDSVDSVVSLTTPTTYLNSSDILDSCTRQEFTVQAVINGQFNSSLSQPFSNFSGK